MRFQYLGGYQNGYDALSTFLTEMTLTILFLFVIFATPSSFSNSTLAGLAIGLTLVFNSLGCDSNHRNLSNPARSFGCALVPGGIALKQLWLFFTAQVVGGILAVFAWNFLEKNYQTIPPIPTNKGASFKSYSSRGQLC